MEHLPLGEDSTLPQLSIPFVCKTRSPEPYTRNGGNDGFLTFSRRHLADLRLNFPSLSSNDYLLSLAQSWLFFGTLTEFFQHNVPSAAFTRIGEGGVRVIQTTALPAYRARWIRSLPSRFAINAGFRQQEARRLGVLLARACWVSESLNEMVGDDPVARHVMFSIKVMLCSLCHAVQTVLPPTPTLEAVVAQLRFVLHATTTDRHFEGTDFLLWDHMVRNEWCPLQIAQLLNQHSATTMVYLASLRRARKHTDHSHCSNVGGCQTSQIDWTNFQPPHVSPDCNCRHVSVNEEEIMAHLENQRIPLLSCTRKPSGNFDIQVIPAHTFSVLGKPTLYYAVSHVWADGLGNPISNSLPRCQFEMLYRKLTFLAKEVSKTRPSSVQNVILGSPALDVEPRVVFWMDVFCVPVQKHNSPRHVRLKEQAIRLMDLTYSCARQVLVLDSELSFATTTMTTQQGERLNLDSQRDLRRSTEALCRFATCSWMGRSWTLQEGALASELWAHHTGRPLLAKRLYASRFPPRLRDQSPPELLAVRQAFEKQAMLPSVGRGTQDLTAAAAYCASAREVQFLEVWNSLIGRSTTQPEDFHCIVANLLDYSATALKGYDSQERMRAIILSQERLPLQLFCLPATRGSHADRTMEWLPERPLAPKLSDDAFAHAVRVRRAHFDMEPACLPFCFYVGPCQSGRLDFCLGLSSKKLVHPCVKLDLPENSSIAEDAQLLVYLDASAQTHPLVSDHRRRGAAFTITERHNGHVNVKYLCSLTFRNCWEEHAATDAQLPCEAVSKATKVSIAGPGSNHSLRFRRPLRVGANLIATLPAKAVFLTALIYLAISLFIVVLVASSSGSSLGSIILFPSGRSFLLLPAVVWTIVVFYVVLTFVLVYYAALLGVIGARYISTPWVQQSYLTDHLPWYVRALYWEKWPSTNGFVMWFRATHQRIATAFLSPRNSPYDLERNDPSVFGRTKRMWEQAIVSRFQKRHIAGEPPQTYVDDEASDTLPLVGEPGNTKTNTGEGLSSNTGSLVSDMLIDAHVSSQLDEQNARKLAVVERVLMATKEDDTGPGPWNIVLDLVAAFQWIGRIEKRRTAWDILFDLGFVPGWG